MRKLMRGLWQDERGLVSVEYALLLSVLVVGGASIWRKLVGQIGTVVDEVIRVLADAGG